MLDLVYRRYGRRVALEWRAAMLGAAVAVAVSGRHPGRVDVRWLFGVGGGVIVLTALSLLALATFRPVTLPPIPAQFTEREVAEAQRVVLRGKAVDPPVLQAATIGAARQGLRLAHMQFAWLPVIGSIWSLHLGEGDFFDVVMYVGIVAVTLGVAGLTWSGVVQRRLGRLDDAEEPTTWPPSTPLQRR